MVKFCELITELRHLIYLQKLRFAQYLLNKWMDFDKIVCFGIH